MFSYQLSDFISIGDSSLLYEFVWYTVKNNQFPYWLEAADF